jgi:RND family efflux transporter MFP subunit
MKSLVTKVLGILVVLSACSNGADTQADEEKDAVSVNITAVQPTTFKHFINLQGNVESDKTISITPKVTATVDQINVRAGEKVERGAVLAVLDGEVTRTQIDQVKSQLKLAETVYERQKNLREENIGSEIQLLESETQVRSLQNQLATLQEQYDNYTITATIGGTVNSVMIKEGENITPVEPAFQIANSEALKVTAEVSEAYINRVETTDSVTVTLPGINRELTKPIDVVSRVIDPANRTFDVEVSIPNINGLVRPNMLAKLKINDYRREGVLAVPINVVQETHEGAFIYVAKKKGVEWIAESQSVETGISYGDQIIIEEGLQPGDYIITVGYNNVNDGDLLSVKED